jgi:mRNA interferase HigB
MFTDSCTPRYALVRAPLVEFAANHSHARVPRQMWRKTIGGGFVNFADLKRAFNATDKIGDSYVFDIDGNKYRIIAAVHFNVRNLYVRHVFTHQEYSKWKP